jgi:hypothetical protein
MNHYRFYRRESRPHRSEPVPVVSLFESDDGGIPVREINTDENMFFTPRG